MIFDAHCDIWCDVLARRLRGETDVLRRCHLPRLREGKMEGGIFAIWIDPPYDKDPAARTMQIMDAARAEIAACDEICVVHNLEEILRAKAAGKFYILIGVEGLAALGTDAAGLDRYYDFGARHAMLTWNEQNALATGVRGDPDRGLTAAGRAVIRRMEEKKMLVDVSHLNEKSFRELAAMATRPICATHSNCRALCDAPRNLTDEQLRILRDLDGVVGLNSYNDFTSHNAGEQNVSYLARHAAHMVDVMGITHVGCGFDFIEFLSPAAMRSMTDRSPAIPDMKDAAEAPKLFEELSKLGMTQNELDLIAYGNFHSLLRKTIE